MRRIVVWGNKTEFPLLTFVVSNCGRSTTRPPALRGDMRESTIPKGLYKLMECNSEEDSSKSQKLRTRVISRFKSWCLSSNFCGLSPVKGRKSGGFLIFYFLFLFTRQVEHHNWFVLGIELLVKNQWWKRARIFNVNICVCNEIWILTNDGLSNLLANFSDLFKEKRKIIRKSVCSQSLIFKWKEPSSRSRK